MGSQYNRQRAQEDEDRELLVFGYSAKLYPPDDKTVFMNEERHLQFWNGGGSLRIDRYDCRLLLTSIQDRINENKEEECPTEMMEEEMCEEERYKDMYLDIQEQAHKQANELRKKAEIAFVYNNSDTKRSNIPSDDDSDSENEPFVAPGGIKLPVGLATPDNLKQSHIIERTALFVVEKGPQMEIVIKAKQRNNTEQFGFLDFDNVLYPYYKYISKMIREKKYTPNLKSKEEQNNSTAEKSDDTRRKNSNALTAIASQHSDSDDDSDSDCELHPSLFAVQKRDPSPDILDRTRNAVGPRQKPAPVPIIENTKPFNITQSNDMYASLFKSITGYKEPPKPEVKAIPVLEEKRSSSAPIKEEKIERDSDVDIEWQHWWMNFYGRPPPAKAPNPMIPPPPDMEPVVCRYAEFVARHGAQAEFGLVARPDLKLHFMDPSSPFFSYYQHKVRYAQWEISQEPPTVMAEPEQCSSPHSPAAMNRKQRRRLQDAQKVGPAPPPGVIDPFLLKSAIHADIEMHKTHSCPANLGVVEPVQELKPYIPSGVPVSFSLSKDDTKQNNINVENLPLPAPYFSDSFAGTSSDGDPLLTKPPEPPAISNNQQLDRKEKARIFMEKLLSEKKNQKIKAEEDKINELEKQKADIEQKLATEVVNKPAEQEPGRKPNDNPGKTLDIIDQIINSRIDNLLMASGIATTEKPQSRRSPSPAERKRSREKKSKKHKRKRSRSPSRSRDRSRERRRKRSRSRTPERSYRRRH